MYFLELKDLAVLCGVLFSQCVHGTEELKGRSSSRGAECYGPVERLVRNSAPHLSESI